MTDNELKGGIAAITIILIFLGIAFSGGIAFGLSLKKEIHSEYIVKSCITYNKQHTKYTLSNNSYYWCDSTTIYNIGDTLVLIKKGTK